MHLMSSPPGLGIYLHIPFCATRCDYCAFSTWTDKENLIDDYVDACVIDIQRAQDRGELVLAETVFVGGGTPSLIGPMHLARLIKAIPIASGGEVTIECNPESVDLEMLQILRDAGVTRISLGVQTIHQHVLKGLGRDGDAATAFKAIAAIDRAGFSTFNVDLIYGGAGETDEDFAQSLQAILNNSPAPPHISAYALTIERGTPLSRDAARHPDDDVLADRYDICDEILGSHGLTWYEVSNWARPGHECRHNTNCWQQGNYVAIGCAAHGHIDGRRYRNLGTPELYIDAVRNNASTVAGEELLTGEMQRHEALELSLRTKFGVPQDCLVDAQSLEGLVTFRGGRAILTRRGRLLCNEVTMRLKIPAHSAQFGS